MRKSTTPLISLIYYPVVTLGPMERLGIWFQGCTIRCKGCISDHSWEFDPIYRTPWKKIEGFLKQKYGRLTISGGEPFDQPENLLKLLKMARKYSYTDILVYSGYTYFTLSKKYPEIFDYIDVLVDGPFIKGRKTNKIWKGSSNQRMYILNPDLIKLYKEYFNIKKERKLQFALVKEGVFLIGIPDQKDTEELKHAITQGLSGM